MEKTKSLEEISWGVNEDTYRADSALSYSTLAKFDREGYNKIDSLFDKVDTPSLTFGSAVDAIITGGQEEFDEKFIVAHFPPISDSVSKVVKECFNTYGEYYFSLSSIPDDYLLAKINDLNYQQNWKPETRVKVIREQGEEYYSLLFLAKGKTIIDTQTMEDVNKTVEALQTSPATMMYFNPIMGNENTFKRYYQLKFKATFDGIEYRCMADAIFVDYVNKKIYPVDLKTSSHTEWDFYESFTQWRYAHQARLYWRIIRQNMDNDEFFKDFILENYKFIVVNRKTLTPLVWEFEDTQKVGTLYYGKNNEIEFKDPFDLGKELYYYLNNETKVPVGINIDKPNSIKKWLNKTNNESN